VILKKIFPKILYLVNLPFNGNYYKLHQILKLLAQQLRAQQPLAQQLLAQYNLLLSIQSTALNTIYCSPAALTNKEVRKNRGKQLPDQTTDTDLTLALFKEVKPKETTRNASKNSSWNQS
jgi:hypothetical protein